MQAACCQRTPATNSPSLRLANRSRMTCTFPIVFAAVVYRLFCDVIGGSVCLGLRRRLLFRTVVVLARADVGRRKRTEPSRFGSWKEESPSIHVQIICDGTSSRQIDIPPHCLVGPAGYIYVSVDGHIRATPAPPEALYVGTRSGSTGGATTPNSTAADCSGRRLAAFVLGALFDPLSTSSLTHHTTVAGLSGKISVRSTWAVIRRIAH
jgi:hypothetical protein